MMNKTLIALLGLALVSVVSNAAPAQRPNVILVFADDLGSANLGCYGQKLIRTPHIDRMAAEGMRFTRFYAGSALCLPSRVSMLTGQHLGHSRVRRNGGGGKHQPIEEEDITMGRVFQRAGYRTGMLGKWALGDHFRGNTVARQSDDGPGAVYKHGWDFYLGEPNQTYNHKYRPSHIYRYDPGGLLGAPTPDDALVPRPMEDDPATAAIDESYTTDLYSQRALAFVEASRDRPFFLYLPYQTPHSRFVVPQLEEYTTKQKDWSDGAKVFASMITRLDRDVGALLDKLRATGQAGNTLVVFTSDHGGLKNFDDLFDNNGDLEGYKGSATEGGLRVPCIAWWPGRIAAGGTSDALHAHFDFLPTFAEITGATAPVPIDGISFAPTLMGASEVPAHPWLLLHGGNGDSYYIVRNKGETRSDAEIRAEAVSRTPRVAAFPAR